MNKELLQVGNAAKIREALQQIANMAEQIDDSLGSSEETVYTLRHERTLAHHISECARAALSAPPRNCDLYKTKIDAWVAFFKSDGAIVPSEYWSEEYEDWLFAEVKGEAK